MKKLMALVLAVALVLGMSAVAMAGSDTFTENGSGLQDGESISLENSSFDIDLKYYALDTKCITVEWDDEYEFHYGWKPENQKWVIEDGSVSGAGSKAFDIDVTNKGFNDISVGMDAELDKNITLSPFVKSLDLAGDGKEYSLANMQTNIWTLTVGIEKELSPNAFGDYKAGALGNPAAATRISEQIGVTITIGDVIPAE